MMSQSVPEWRGPVAGQNRSSNTPESGPTPIFARKNGSEDMAM